MKDTYLRDLVTIGQRSTRPQLMKQGSFDVDFMLSESFERLNIANLVTLERVEPRLLEKEMSLVRYHERV